MENFSNYIEQEVREITQFKKIYGWMIMSQPKNKSWKVKFNCVAAIDCILFWCSLWQTIISLARKNRIGRRCWIIFYSRGVRIPLKSFRFTFVFFLNKKFLFFLAIELFRYFSHFPLNSYKNFMNSLLVLRVFLFLQKFIVILFFTNFYR